MATEDISPNPHFRPRATVFLVDDHPLVRDGLRNLINQQPDLMVCGEADDTVGAAAAIGDLLPNIAVVDLSLRSGSGIDLIKDLRIQCPDVRIIVLSMHDESLYAERALRAGARGYVMKRESARNILTGIRRVLAGEVYISEAFARHATERLLIGRHSAPVGGQLIDGLSDRELEVFRRLGQGHSTSQIAADLRLSLKTVQAYCARIKTKLGLANATELLREALRFEDRAGQAR